MNQFKIYTRAMVTNSLGQVLLLHKNSRQRIAPNKWVLPGGTCEWGEGIEETICRELSEEVNFHPIDLHLMGVRTMVLESIHWQGIYFSAVGDTENIRNVEQDKHDDLKWFDLNSLPEDVDAEERRMIAQFLQGAPHD